MTTPRRGGMTMLQKILARKAGLPSVSPGEIVVVPVDTTVMIDLVFSNGRLPADPKRIADPDRVVVMLDHAVPAPTVHDAAGHALAREFVKKFGIKRFFDIGDHGICHQLILENGIALPGQVLVCSDSHTLASGAFNCAARGLGAAEILQIVCTGRTWFKVAPAVRYLLEGRLPPGVYGKDIFLHLAGEFGSVEGHDVEFGGSGLGSLSLDDRATVATMCAEISANFALFPADALLVDYLRSVTDAEFEPVESDPNAEYARVHSVELSRLRPYVAFPDDIPGNTRPVDEIGERIAIQQAFVGSCANGKLEDLRVAAEVVRGRRVAPGVRLLVTPASQRVYLQAVRLGYVETLVEAGAVVTNSTCGACYGGHMGVLGPGETCITSSTRNFKGRMGSPTARIYMGSSATVAASAIAGWITDPAPYLSAGAS
jgi:3-isopropylmalate/(R)-2-methylmalate dehydratase large subunit